MDLITSGSGLGPALVQQKRLRAQELETLLQQANAASLSFAEQLVQSRRLSARELAEFTEQFFGYPLFDLAAIDATKLPQGLLAHECLETWRVIPLSVRGNRLMLGASDPTLSLVFDAVRLMTGLAVEVNVVEEDKLASLLHVMQHSHVDTLAAQTGQQLDEAADFGQSLAPSAEWVLRRSDDAPVVRFLRQILEDAVRGRASDIHFEPYDKMYRIRYRVDGKLRTIVQPPLPLKDRVAACIKVISRLDITEKRLPQDGRLTLRLSSERAVDFRVSTLPTLFGEKIVLRLLNTSSMPLDIEALGLEPFQQTVLRTAIAKQAGMILVTGPTGSGKTITLYSCLALLNQADIHIATVEDPIEIVLPGVNQVNVNVKVGLTFAKALRALLRQDPDVLMVGEIRDAETASIAIKAAETGHLVLATLHANTASAAIARLLNLEVAPYNVAACVTLIIAQRLVRRLCMQCQLPEEQSLLPRCEAALRRQRADEKVGARCIACGGVNYQGRVGLFELIPISDAIRHLIIQRASTCDIAALARQQGMIDLRQAGVIKVSQGVTSLAEVLALTPDS